MASKFAIYVRGLRKSYNGFEAVKGIDFEVQTGEVFGLLGLTEPAKRLPWKFLKDYVLAVAVT